MKPFHWSAVPDHIVKETVWKNLNDDKIKLDTDSLEDMFCSGKKHTHVDEHKERRPAQRGNQPISLIDNKRAYTISIVVTRLRMTNEAIRDAFFAMNEEILTEDCLATLRSCAPTDEELEIVRGYDGDIKILGKAESFLKVMDAIPRVAERIRLFSFKQRFDSLLQDSQFKLVQLENAIAKLMSSHSLRKVLEIVLAIGNYMNGGTRNGGKYGFRLSTLNKLRSTKSSDTKTTLLYYMVVLMETHYASAMQFGTELSNMAAATRVELAFLKQDVSSIMKQCRAITASLKSVPAKPEDAYNRVMSKFITAATKTSAKLQERINMVTTSVVELAMFYGEPPKTDLEEIIKIFYNFGKDYQVTYDEVLRDRLALKEEEKRRARLDGSLSSGMETHGPESIATTDNAELIDAVNAKLGGNDAMGIKNMIRERRRKANLAPGTALKRKTSQRPSVNTHLAQHMAMKRGVIERQDSNHWEGDDLLSC